MASLTTDAVEKVRIFSIQNGLSSPADINIFRLTEQDAADAGVSLSEIKASKRVHTLAGTPELAAGLAARGIDSAFKVARMPQRQFAATHGKALGLTTDDAADLHDRATRIANRTMQLFATVHGGIASPHARAMASATLGEDAVQYFENLPSYQTLFGSLNYCACEQCQSIFGPAAYFVDLMRIIEEYVTKPNIGTIPAPFLLKSRRPDLWDIPLTCAATNGTMPALDIVDQVLMAAVRKGLDVSSDDAMLKQMATTTVYPSNLPFNYPLDRIRVLCGKVQVPLADIYRLWGAAPDAVVDESIGLSPERAAIVTTPVSDPAKIAAFYDVTAAQLPDLSQVSLFCAKTGLNIPQLQQLIIQDVTAAELTAGVPENLFINQGLGDNFLKLHETGDDKTSQIVNLNNTALDQINRLMRLALALGWSTPTTDWCLRAAKNGAAPAIDATALAGLDCIQRFSTLFSVDVMQAATLLGPIKSYGGTDASSSPSPFDLLFNGPTEVAQSGAYRPSGNPLNPLFTTAPLPWTPGSSATADMAAITRVAGGLGLPLTALNLLGGALFGTSAPVDLTVANLSALYRHGLLSRCFNLAMDQYVLFLELNGATGKTVLTPVDVDALVAAWTWMTSASLDVYTIAYAAKGLPSPYVNPLYSPANVGPWQKSLQTLVPDAGAPGAGDAIAQQLAIFFGADPTLATPCLTMALAAVPLPSGATSWEQAFLAADGDGKPLYLPYVQDVIDRQSRWLVLANAVPLAAAQLDSLVSYPAAYGVPADFKTITWSMVASITGFAQLQDRFNDVRDDLVRYVALVETQASQDEQITAIAAATGWAPGQIKQILAGPAKGIADLPRQITLMDSCFKQISAFGADASFLGQLEALSPDTAAANWSDYEQMAQLVQSKVSARLGQKRWDQVALEVEGACQVHLRDALLGLELMILNRLYPDIATANNVYEFLLTDVLTGPEAQLSYIKEGLNALQLYLQRCRLRLEPGVDQLDIPPVWWEWMMDYRVWEANRRIFVYPENYLLPTLRTDQTSLFKALAQDLQQSEITPAYVEKAYATYLTSFAEVSALKPVESYRCTVDDPQRGKIDGFYLFARTDTAPYTFYYCRQLESAPWSEWQKIGQTINSPYVTPVYAFNRMFLFWVEVKVVTTPSVQVGTSGGQTNNDIVYQASLKYTFQDHQGEWVQPQTLAGDMVICFKGQGTDVVPLASDTLFADDWDLDSVPWRRLTALRLNAANWPFGQAPSSDFERIVIGFGPYVTDVGTQNLTPDSSAPNNVAAQAFAQTLTNRMWDNNRIVLERLSGGLTIMDNWVLNAALDVTYLGHNREFLLVDPYRPSAPLSQFRVNLDDLNGSVQIMPTGGPITADNFGDMLKLINLSVGPTALASTAFASETISTAAATAIFNALKAAGVLSTGGAIDPAKMPTLDLNAALADILGDATISENQLPEILGVLLANLGSPLLFGQVIGRDSAVTSVKNQPGWFKLDAGPESFLINPARETSGTPAYSLINTGALQSGPLVNANSLVLPMLKQPISVAVATQIFSVLRQYNIIDSRGVVNVAYLNQVPLSVVLANFNLSAAQLAALNGVLYNMSAVYSTDFAVGKISVDTSKKIYDLLQTYGIIDQAQRLHLEILTSELLAQVLANMLMTGELLPRDVSTIYRILVETPTPYNISYWNAGNLNGFTNLTGLTFDVTRLTTAASAPLNRAFFVGGIDALLSLHTQSIPVTPVLPFGRLAPSGQIVWPNAIDGAQVDFDGLYGQYFWELFYHGPMLVANSLAANQKFQDAISWFQYVFDPTVKEIFVQPDTFQWETAAAPPDGQISQQLSGEAFTACQNNNVDGAPIISGEGRVNPKFTATTSLSFLPQTMNALQVEEVRNVLLNYQLAAPASHYWMFRPFRMQTLESLRYMLSDDNPAILAYEDDPFSPFAIARLRPSAFEKATVMQYVDTLIQWGDSCFARGTWESIVAATMLYVYASNLLGPRPQEVGTCSGQDPATFQDIEDKYGDDIPVFLIDLESTLVPVGPATIDPVPIESHAFNDLGAYFCVPENDVLISYWDRVEAQLYKIRHSLDINGNYRQLALFEPPLDPMALVKAAAGSNNFLPSSSAAGKVTPPYRFSAALSRARMLTQSAMQFGGQLQAALERSDAEGLEVLRNTFEGQLLALNTQILEDQINRAANAIAALTVQQNGAQAVVDHYTKLIAVDLIPAEQTNLDAMAVALVFNIASNIMQTASAIGFAAPQVGSPFAMTYGGQQIGNALSAAAAALSIGGEISSFVAQRSLTMAGYQRRSEDWNLALSNAQHEYDALGAQIAAANDDLAAAKQQLVVHNKQTQQNQQIATYLTTKFSNQALYQWMAARLSGLYYQTYRLAMQASVAAQSAYQYETDTTRSFIDFDYWDPAHSGLLAGEGLTLALDLMEAAYATVDTRVLEIERMVSLASIDPMALETLKQTGSCEFSFPELMFDYDYPGQYCRRIKSLSVSIPAIVGPYQNIKATLTQTGSYIAVTDDVANVEWLITKNGQQPANVWTDPNAANLEIALSRSLDDPGLFVLNFEDARYLPFEGTGAVSSWKLSLPKEANRIDFEQLSDVVVTLRYTARAGSHGDAVKALLRQNPIQAGYYVDLAQSYATPWRAFLQDHGQQGTQLLTFAYSPAWLGELKSMTASTLALAFTAASDVTWPSAPFAIGTLTVGTQPAVAINVGEGGIAAVDAAAWTRPQMTADWTITLDLTAILTNVPKLLDKDGWIDPAQLLDIEMILTCNVKTY